MPYKQCTDRGCKHMCVEGREYCEHHALIHDRCEWKHETAERIEFCRKLTQPGSSYCPKHIVLTEGWQHDQNAKMEKARNAKARKKLLRDALPESPLAAYNPKFDEKRRSGYEV